MQKSKCQVVSMKISCSPAPCPHPSGNASSIYKSSSFSDTDRTSGLEQAQLVSVKLFHPTNSTRCAQGALLARSPLPVETARFNSTGQNIISMQDVQKRALSKTAVQ